ncbi:pyridoxal phosphate-dependent aminotransferase [Entomomonas asaccharolytica]|uniref:Pyridoxal phosphate-dependent aminotransferase n=1 Tax=Entomomonas asaccharolytica TaxID=2785331 RepID=A0A974NHC0_9GAMM|nr:pyridoxal phosphate-dependent aminotransferase [Entomomonas asaccharolytica]QQP86611.1 pyridoxal phosphate-dependent aminotransferase [Entomomonas asaccharolytica]
MSFYSKLPNLGTTIFTQMSQLAAETGSINLSQGFPDFDGPLALREAVSEYTLSGHNQYAPMIGIQPLREQIAKKIQYFYNKQVNENTEITITPGATQAIFCAIQAVIKTGEEVIVFDPCYDSYEPAVKLAGGRCIHIPLQLPHFTIDWQQLQDAITPKTRLIIINTPHNPSGATLTAQDLQQLAAIIRNKDIYLIGDEVYEHLVFDQAIHHSLLTHDELFARSFVISSFGKSFHVTGWKIGYVVAPAELTTEFRKIHQYVSFSTVTPLQFALADFMAKQPNHLIELADFYQQKRDLFCSLLTASQFTFTPTPSTYFQLLDYSRIKPDFNDLQMVEWLVKKHSIAAIPISVFYQQPPQSLRLVRLCFAKKDDTLRQAAERLCAV